MGWRIVCIEEAFRINYKLNSIGVVQKDEVVWISLDEIDCIVLETQICITTIKLLVEIVKKGITLILCGDNHMPIGLLNSICDNQRSAKLNRIQIQWLPSTKKKIWTQIIKQKITNQIHTLIKLKKHDKVHLLTNYIEDIQEGDVTNREGHAAKVYFNEMFGKAFTRQNNSEDIINISLNYVYQIVRSKIAQTIVSHGYLPSLGIFHCSEYNYFGLADDLIEVYRPIIDYYVYCLIKETKQEYMTPSYKTKLLNVLFEYIEYNNKKQKIIESIKLYVINVLDSISNNKFKLEFPTLIYDK